MQRDAAAEQEREARMAEQEREARMAEQEREARAAAEEEVRSLAAVPRQCTAVTLPHWSLHLAR